MGSILLGAIEEQKDGESTEAVAKRVAHETGEEIGQTERDRRHLRPPGPGRTIAIVADVSSACGYEPYLEGDTVRVRSCPFHALAERNRDIVCAFNRELMGGVVTGLGSTSVDVALTPTEGQCCVTIARHLPSASPEERPMLP